jgi:predicted acyltransferase
MGALGLMVALYIGDRHGVLDFLAPIRTWWDIGQLAGSHPAIVTAGMLAGTCLPADRTFSGSRTARLAGLGLGLLAAGFLLRPLHGFHKIGGTESYALATAGICTLAFLLFHIGIDCLGFKAGTRFLQPVGANPLLADLLPDVLDKVLSLTGSWGLFWPLWPAGGWAGMLNAALMTAAVLGLTWTLTRWGFVLRL